MMISPVQMRFMFLNRYNDRNETIPVLVNFDSVRFFYPWDGRNKGTFIDFGGSALAKAYGKEIENA